jgi:dipeptidyl aminopeptidase/acylaminoacyl peptidase
MSIRIPSRLRPGAAIGLPAAILALALLAPAAPAKHPMTFDDLIGFERVADPQVSPDGRWVACTVTRFSKDANGGDSDVWLVPLAGGAPRQLTASPKRDAGARWAPDGRRLAFISARGGTPQVWTLDVTGGEARQRTRLSTGADGVIWSRDGSRLAFTSEVYPDCPDDACNRKRSEAAGASRVQAKTIDRLLYRHWDGWKDGKRTHVFVVAEGGGDPVDVTPGDFDAPPFSLGGPSDYDLSPDGRELCFTRNTDPSEATSTNADLWLIPSSGGAARRITTNPAYDGSPLYSPDGRYVAYRAQRRAGFESDRFELMLYDRSSGAVRSLTPEFDRPVEGFDWSPDGRTLVFTASDQGFASIHAVAVGGGAPRLVIGRSYNDDVRVAPDGRTLVFTRQSISSPAEIFRASLGGADATALTAFNAARLAALELASVEDVRYRGAGGSEIQAWLLRPPGFVSGRRHPALLLIHGGPQGAWSDSFSYRWNLQMFAARGYVVLAPNPRGSVGFGQEFTDAISGDWGGKVYDDLMKGADDLAARPFVDRERISAAGASFGGYMVNWIAGHTARFRALVSHDGVFNLASMYGSTEELWFPEWEFRGTPWTRPEQYARFSPSSFVQGFRTPMLVIHGELDYRVPVAEGMQLFTALQRMKVPSRFLYFPDEGHWVLKPLNSELWYRTVLGWLDTYTKP